MAAARFAGPALGGPAAFGLVLGPPFKGQATLGMVQQLSLAA